MTGEENKMSLSDLLNEGMVYSKLRDLKQLHPYILRSYKTMQLLTNDYNNKLICETGANIIEKFCTLNFFIYTILISNNSQYDIYVFEDKRRYCM